MAKYPSLPDNRLVVGGIDLSVRFRLILLDGYGLSPPQPKVYTVDIPGGDGVIDLTEALTGDVHFENREQEFEFLVLDVGNNKTFERRKTEVSNYLNGRSFDYQMSFDPGYTYHGRFSVSEYTHEGTATNVLGHIKVAVSAEPYKLKKRMTYILNAVGGRLYRFESGRKPVRPVIECEQPVFVTWQGVEFVVPVGTHTLNDVLFREGVNEIYINSYKLYLTSWSALAEGGSHEMTWDEASAYMWDELQLLETGGSAKTWDDLATTRYEVLAESTWNSFAYQGDELGANAVIYLQYDWKDL